MTLSVGVKAAAVAGAAVVLAAGIGIPVYLHNENEKALAAMAIIQQQEAEEAARIEAAKLEAERVQAEYDSLIEAVNKSIDTVRSEYDSRIVSNTGLSGMTDDFNKLNAFLATNGTVDNEADIKKAVQQADELIIRLDVDDPSVTADADAAEKLSALNDAIGDAVEALGLEDAVCPVDRIEIASKAVGGTVGDIVSVKATVYPTMVQKGAVLAWSASDNSIVDIDASSGEMTLLKAGECTVKVIEQRSGKEVTFKVTVEAKKVSGTDWYTAESAEQFAPSSSAPAASSAPAGQQNPQKTPPNGQKEGNTNDLAPGTKLPGGITIKDKPSGDRSAYN